MFVLSFLHEAEVTIENDEELKVEPRCLVVVLEDFEGYLRRKIDHLAPHCVIRKVNMELVKSAKQLYVDPLIKALFSFTETIFKNLNFSMFFSVIDVVDYVLLLLPFSVDQFEDRTFLTMQAIQEDESIDQEIKAQGFLNLNRIIARILLIKRSNFISSDHPIWSTILKILNTEYNQGKFQERFCYAILLVSVGESILESTELSLASLFRKLSITPSDHSPQKSASEATIVLLRILDLLLNVLKLINFNIADFRDLIRENLEELINSSEEVEAKVA